jgi:hypothetical protein
VPAPPLYLGPCVFKPHCVGKHPSFSEIKIGEKKIKIKKFNEISVLVVTKAAYYYY